MSLTGTRKARLSYAVFSGVPKDGVLATEAMAARPSRPIDREVRAHDVGWVDPLHPSRAGAIDASMFKFDAEIFGAAKIDTIDVPSSAVKYEVARRRAAHEAESGRKMDRSERAELREVVRAELAARAVVKTQVVEVTWSEVSGQLRVFATSKKVVGAVERLCGQFLDDVRDVTYPMLAAELCGDAGKKLERLDLRTGMVLAKLDVGSEWLGREFLTWLGWCSWANEGEFSVVIDGKSTVIRFWPAGTAVFVDGDRKVTVKDDDAMRSNEGQAALRSGALVDRMAFVLEHGALRWEGRLGPLTFGARGLVLPALVLGREVREDDAFHGNFMQVERFDAIHIALFQAFLDLRADKALWERERQSMWNWIANGGD